MFILYEKQNNKIDMESIVIKSKEEDIRKEMKSSIDLYTKPRYGEIAIIKNQEKNKCILEWDDGEEFSIHIQKIVDMEENSYEKI